MEGSDSNNTLMLLFRLIPILVNGMKYSEIDIILLKVRYQIKLSSFLCFLHMYKW